MKVFSRYKFIEERGIEIYNSNKIWVDKCHMRTKEECNKRGYLILNKYLAEAREVNRDAKEGEYVRVTCRDDSHFSYGDILMCKNYDEGSSLFCYPDGSEEWYLNNEMYERDYVVREIIEEENKMEDVKSLLRSGDIAVFGNGNKYRIFTDYKSKDGWTGIFANLNCNGFMGIDSYNDDLTVKYDEEEVINTIYNGLNPEYFELIKKQTSDPVINALLDKLGLEAGEKFNIEGNDWNPYYFNEDGMLIDRDGDSNMYKINELIYDTCKIEKLSEPKEMIVGEIEKILGHKVKIVKGE